MRSLIVGLACLWLTAAAGAVAPAGLQPAQTPPTRSTIWGGVYSAAQAQRGLGGLRGRGAGLMAAAQDASLLGVILTHKDDLKLSAEQVATMRRIDSTTTAANAGDSQMASRLGASRSKRIPRPHHHAAHAIAPTSISPVPETPVNDPGRSAPPRTNRRSSVGRSCRWLAGIRIWGSGVRR